MDKEDIVHIYDGIFSSVQSLSHVRLIVTPWIAAHQASLSITNSRCLLKLMSIESWNITESQKKNEIMPFTTTQMNLEIIILNKINQRQISYDIAYIWNLKKNKNKKTTKLNLFPNPKETHRHRKQIHGYQREKGGGKRINLEVGINIYTQICINR